MSVARARITSKGQVTLPVALRRKLGLDTGDEIVFEFGDGDRILVRPLRRRSAAEFSGAFAGAGGAADLDQLRRRAWRGRAKKLERARPK